MNAVDMIVKLIDDQGITQTEAARICGMSRQNLWDKLNNRNPKFKSMYQILKSFGYDIEVIPIGDAGRIPNREKLIEEAEGTNITFDSLERILGAMGYRINIFKVN